MVVPAGAETFAEALRIGAETYHALKAVLHERGLATAVGDEGGFAPDLPSSEVAIEVILEASRAVPGTATGWRSRSTRRPRSSSATARTASRGVRRTRPAMADFYAWARRPLSDRLDRGRPRRGRLGRLARADRALRRPAPARRRRHLRHEPGDPPARHRRGRRKRDPRQGEPDRDADRDARRRSTSPGRTATRQSSRTDRGRPRTRRSPTSSSRPAPARSRPEPRPGRIGSPSTTSCCGSRRSSARRPCTPAGRPSRGFGPRRLSPPASVDLNSWEPGLRGAPRSWRRSAPRAVPRTGSPPLSRPASTRARLNFSHGTHEEHRARAELVRAAGDDAGKPLALVADLQGPKLRIGDLAAPRVLVRGQEVVVAPEELARDGELPVAPAVIGDVLVAGERRADRRRARPAACRGGRRRPGPLRRRRRGVPSARTRA